MARIPATDLEALVVQRLLRLLDDQLVLLDALSVAADDTSLLQALLTAPRALPRLVKACAQRDPPLATRSDHEDHYRHRHDRHFAQQIRIARHAASSRAGDQGLRCR